jgi:hypothetical protein
MVAPAADMKVRLPDWEIINAGRRRKGLLAFIAVLLFTGLVTSAAIGSTLAFALFDGMGGSWLWPLLIVILAAGYGAAGEVVFRSSGRPQFFPLLAVCALAGLGYSVWSLLMCTAAEWSLLQATAAIFLLGAACVGAVIGFISYAEPWRRPLWNIRVVDAVLRTLPGGTEQTAETVTRILNSARPNSEFSEIVERQKSRRGWGSGHCLQVIIGAFEERRKRCVPRPDGILETEAYDLFLDTGSDLLLFLAAPLPEEVISVGDRRERTLDICRQLITVWLEGTEDQRVTHRARADVWIEAFRSEDPFYCFLSICFELALGRRRQAAGEVVQTVVDMYRQLCDEPGPHPRPLADREICQNTWLALARRNVPAQACFDAWMAMRMEEGQPPVMSISEETAALDAALLAATTFLRDHYQSWAAQTHEDWRQGLTALAQKSEEARP